MSQAELDKRSTELAHADEMSIESVVAQVHKVQELMRLVMKDGEHYGVIPGTDKPTLLKPGAEKLCMTFRLNPQYEILYSQESPELVSFVVNCHLTHITTGQEWGSGMGACNSREKKYRFTYTPMEPKPTQAEANELKEQGKGGWRKIGTKWVFHLRAENNNAYDYTNTILKMASKRALVAAVLNATAASDIFTQDMEETQENAVKASEIVPAKEETLQLLVNRAAILAEYAPDLWGHDILTRNVQTKFSVKSIEDLSEDQAVAVLSGMDVWADLNPPPTPEDNGDEVVTGDIVEEAPEKDESEQTESATQQGEEEAKEVAPLNIE